MKPLMTDEDQRLLASAEREVHWKRWGPYLSERQWGTVREDYSPNGDAWNYFPHDHARSRAYRWGEDGIAGICDRHQHICFALALWNEKDRYSERAPLRPHESARKSRRRRQGVLLLSRCDPDQFVPEVSFTSIRMRHFRTTSWWPKTPNARAPTRNMS